MNEIEEIKTDVKDLKADIEDIKNNHLKCMYDAVDEVWASLQFLMTDISNLRWFILASVGVLAVVVAVIECFG